MSAVHARSFVNTIVNGYDHDVEMHDIFNPELEDGIKESTLNYFSKPEQITTAQFNKTVVSEYQQRAPTLSKRFALAGILDSPPEEPGEREAIKSQIIEALAQDHLQSKGHELDPIASMISAVDPSLIQICKQVGFLPMILGLENPLAIQACSWISLLPAFSHDEKRCFYAQSFQEVFSQCSIEKKREIIEQLQHFESALNTWPARLQRMVFKVEGICNRYLTERNAKLVASVAFSIGCYFAAHKIVALAGRFFTSSIFISFSIAVTSRMPVIPGLNRVSPYIVKGATFVASGVLAGIPMHSFKIYYQRVFGFDAIVQMGIDQGLEAQVSKGECSAANAKELLDGGMKAYQIWMHLVEKGPWLGLFEDDTQ